MEVGRLQDATQNGRSELVSQEKLYTIGAVIALGLILGVIVLGLHPLLGIALWFVAVFCSVKASGRGSDSF